jgi:RNA polymerase sigma-70 factor (ECF subfamily)
LDLQSDEQLVIELRNGSVDAFAELYHRYKRQIFTFCLKLTGDQSLAEDATHDTFLKMYNKIDTLSDPSTLRSWLYSIARNGVYKQLSRNQRNGSLEEASVWIEETPLLIAEQSEVKQIMSACVETLKTEYREVLYLREYEQHSYEEIAVITGDSVGSVKSRLFKARKALAQKLKSFFKE